MCLICKIFHEMIFTKNLVKLISRKNCLIFFYRKQIDDILQDNLFKPDAEEKCGKDTMIAYIDLK